MKYQYDLYKQDGTIERIGTFEDELPFGTYDGVTGLYEYLNCSTIEVIPDDYLPASMKLYSATAIAFGDEDGRYKEGNERNPHCRVLRDRMNREWDVVGDVVVMSEVA